jgi:hypothetical protein
MNDLTRKIMADLNFQGDRRANLASTVSRGTNQPKTGGGNNGQNGNKDALYTQDFKDNTNPSTLNEAAKMERAVKSLYLGLIQNDPRFHNNSEVRSGRNPGNIKGQGKNENSSLVNWGSLIAQRGSAAAQTPPQAGEPAKTRGEVNQILGPKNNCYQSGNSINKGSKRPKKYLTPDQLHQSRSCTTLKFGRQSQGLSLEELAKLKR